LLRPYDSSAGLAPRIVQRMSLSPGERIELKKSVAASLGQQEWSDMDLILDEFGFPISDSWEGDRSSYVMSMLYRADDEALAQLHSYLRPSSLPPASPQPDAFDDPANPWSGTGFRLFLSHVTSHAEHAGALRQELARRSVDAFVAHDSISPTEDWKNVILYALSTCDACLALLTPGFKESNWTDQEVGYCIARGLLVIPLEFGVTPYGFLGTHQSLKVRPGQSQIDLALSVSELLVRKPQSTEAMTRALVQRWRLTDSYEAARENYSLLRGVPGESWNQSLVTEVWDTWANNSQVRDANIDWRPCEEALVGLFKDLPYKRPTSPDESVPF
jgi:hypothetical protein